MCLGRLAREFTKIDADRGFGPLHDRLQEDLFPRFATKEMQIPNEGMISVARLQGLCYRGSGNSIR